MKLHCWLAAPGLHLPTVIPFAGGVNPMQGLGAAWLGRKENGQLVV